MILRNDIIIATNWMRMIIAGSAVRCNVCDELLQLNLLKDHINSDKHKERKLELLHKLESIRSKKSPGQSLICKW